ncbi:phosphate propanoyltransferase [Tepiditoga spiralis]|uniref:Phosphate propanoyltransferase n=1 Tax=Tepiditoga spiralis TaxID=2108365 RepID=A0A7G1G655_9BACT|nr:phosphate propanoyltransferase [Tepiditoga spiralis]BBE30826.1 phosphate propanoyltransferase [Tepiditoga spiralis]
MKLKESGIVVGVSNRHLHLSQKDLEILFGKDHELKNIKDLKQPGQYAAEEVVTLVGPKGKMERVRVLGPVRKETQVEISKTDAFKLGVNPPVRDSGDLDGTPGIKIVGPKGEVELEKGLILAKRHIHMHTKDAEFYGVKDKDIVYVMCNTDGRKTIYGDVLIRVSEKYALEFHVDTDEANGAFLKTGDEIKIVEEL